MAGFGGLGGEMILCLTGLGRLIFFFFGVVVVVVFGVLFEGEGFMGEVFMGEGFMGEVFMGLGREDEAGEWRVPCSAFIGA